MQILIIFQAISYGTIPYLGTFLTDLTMIDTAIPDRITDDGLINFDKRRKEFEVLAQIKLLQGAAKAYAIDTQPRFMQWWETVLVLDEREAFELSCQIEPNLTSSQSSSNLLASVLSVASSVNDSGTRVDRQSGQRYRRKGTSLGFHHRKNDSIASTASSSTSDQTDSMVNSSPGSSGDLLESGGGGGGRLSAIAATGMSSASSSSSLPSMDASLASSSNVTTSK
jgi:ral guanine nucleotide dissociation stimulator-like 1